VNRRRIIVLLLLAVAVLAPAILATAIYRRSAGTSAGLLIELDRSSLPADGASGVNLVLRPTTGRAFSPDEITLQIVDGERRAQVESLFAEGRTVRAVVRVGILPGLVMLEARAKGTAPGRAEFVATLDPADRVGDGTPDFLQFDGGDREAFRRWFTFLGEVQAYEPPEKVPREIGDCAALLRFAYREALREHNGDWASSLELPTLPGLPSVKKYHYPFTPLGASLFRVKPGPFRAEDLAGDAFAQFADAETLQRLNTHFVTRDIRRAQPGDLLFFRQLSQDLPFHAMIFLGPSQLEPDMHSWIVYHTGPIAGTRGEIRRVRVEELLQHPSPRWRPVPGNVNFLGVFRWNILR